MDPVTAEKNTAISRYNLLHKVTVLLRLFEALLLTALAIWSSGHAADLVRHAIPLLLGPRFLFLVANAIVLSLLLLHSPRYVTASISDDDISAVFASPHPPAPETPDGEVVFDDKRVVSVGGQVRRECGRSRSVRMRVRRRRSPELLRSETDVGKEKKRGEEEEGDDEFRRTIEAFIEKHWKFQKEESLAMAIVAAN